MKKHYQLSIQESQAFIIDKIYLQVKTLLADQSFTSANPLEIANSEIYEKLFSDTSLIFIDELRQTQWSLNRKQLQKFSIKCFSQNDLLNPILLMMAWGYGSEDVGPTRVFKFYKDSASLNLLGDIHRSLRSDHANYGELLKKISASVPGVGDVYASKILYTLSFGIDRPNLPIILDRRVVRSLGKIIELSEVKARYCALDASGGVTNITKNKYNTFCSEIGLVSQRLNISSADVENILFNWRGGE